MVVEGMPKKEGIYIYIQMADSWFCTAETDNIVKQLYSNKKTKPFLKNYVKED